MKLALTYPKDAPNEAISLARTQTAQVFVKNLFSKRSEIVELLEPLLDGDGGADFIGTITSRLGPIDCAIQISKTLSPDQRQRFDHGTQIFKELRHTGIAKFLSSGQALGISHDQQLKLLWRAIELGDLELGHSIDTNGPLNPKQFKALTKQICSVLAYLHSQGIVHRKLRPESFIFKTDSWNHILLVDLENCLKASDQNQHPHSKTRSDIVQAGPLFWFMATGARSFTTTKEPNDGPFQGRLRSLVQAMTAQDPKQRPQTIAEVQHSLSRL